MRRLALAAFAALPLAGCSGLGHFENDTLTLPGANPSLPSGASETMLRVEAKPTDLPPILPEAGNVWPGRPKPFPTLGEVEKQTEAASGQTGPSSGSAPGGPLAPVGEGGGSFQMKSNPNAASTIVIPNGNGTSTVISPDGAVHVIPTPHADLGAATSSTTTP